MLISHQKLNLRLYFYIKFCSILLFCLNLSISQAQYPNYNHYNIEHLLPTNEIYCVFQDHKGYIWIGTDLGVFKFNGKKFIKYSSPHLKSNSATGLCESTDGKIFGYNFSSQLFYIENEKMKVVAHSKHAINNLDCAKDGYLWMTTNQGVYKLNTTNLKITPGISFKKNKLYGGNAYTSLIRICKTEKYFFNLKKVFRINHDQSIHQIEIPNYKQENPILISKSISSPWVFKINGEQIFTIKGNKLVEFKNPSLNHLILGKKITNVVETSPTDLWICTFSGVIYYNKKTGKASLYFPKYAFSNIIKDHNNQYWLSTLNHGLLHLPFLDQTTWNSETQAFGNDFITHITHSNKNIYAGASGGEIYQLNRSNFSITKQKLPIQSDFGFMYYEPSNEKVYFNLTSQLFELKNNKIHRINHLFRPAKDMLKGNKTFIVTSSQGTYVLNELSDTNQINPIDPSWGRKVLPYKVNYYLIATNEGILVLKHLNNKAQVCKKINPNTQFYSIAQIDNAYYALDFRGNIYKVTKDLSLKKILTMNREERFTKLNHYKQYLVLSSTNGIYFYHLTTKKTIHLQKENGLVSNHIQDFIIDGSQLWIATSKGIQLVDLSIINYLKLKSKLYLKSIRSKYRSYKNKPINIDFNEDLTIEWDALSYHSFGKHQILYRLNQQDWNAIPGSQNILHFENLRAGVNELELKLIDLNGVEGENRLVLKIKVGTPFYQKLWFYLLLMSMVAFISFLIYKKRIQILENKQKKELEKIQLESDLRWSQQKALKAQMNPHFLFNILNSIKGYIYENDKTNAIKYLSDFSSLVRDVLELSSLSYVSLEKELEFIKVYIELEAMLLEEDFDYEINFPKDLDISFIQIPTLILQPYIENAFKHGLRFQKGHKKLLLNIYLIENDEYLIIDIIDNGIGREKSAEMNQKSDKRTSFATNSLNQRMQLLNQEVPNSIVVQIIDLNEDHSISKGTQVQIKIKL